MTNVQTNPFFTQHEEGNTFCSCNECLPFEMPKNVATDWDSEWTSLDVKLTDEAHENSKYCDHCDNESEDLTFVETYNFTGYVCPECREHEIKA